MPLDSDQLRSFVAVAELGSFTRAAEEVHRTQAAVSMQIKKLEERVGKTLFDRSGRETKLTHDGQVLLGYARKIVALNHEAEHAFADDTIQGEVRLGLPDDYAERLLPSVLAAFHRTHPAVDVLVECFSSHIVAEKLAQGDLDMGLVTHSDAGGMIVRREQLLWIGSDRLFEEQPDPIPLALSPSPCVWRRVAIDAMNARGHDTRVAFSSSSAAALNSAVVAGLAYSVLPESAVKRDVRVMTAVDGFPPLPTCDIAILRAKHATLPVFDALVSHINRRLNNFGDQIAA